MRKSSCERGRWVHWQSLRSGDCARRVSGFAGWTWKFPEFTESAADEFVAGDLRDPKVAEAAVEGIDDVYQLAADMGGAGYIFTGEHDACVMHNSATINLNTVEAGRKAGVKRFFYSSSACIYPERNPAGSGQSELC